MSDLKTCPSTVVLHYSKAVEGKLMQTVFFKLIVLSSILFLSQFSRAQGSSGNLFFGANLGITTTEQDDMNTLQSRANVRDGGISVSSLKNAYEGSVELGWRFSGTIFAVSLRPGYFYQKEDGSGSSGSYEYSLTGFTIFPIFRLFPLESDLMRFYMQIGLGYGQANGTIKEGSAQAEFKGSAYGSLVGLGAEFIMTPNHSLGVEGSLRYLTYERNLITSSSGTFAGDSLTQSGVNQEAEIDGRDLQSSMSGILFMARYAFYY